MVGADVKKKFGGFIACECSVYFKKVAANNQEKCIREIRYVYRIYFTIAFARNC